MNNPYQTPSAPGVDRRALPPALQDKFDAAQDAVAELTNAGCYILGVDFSRAKQVVLVAPNAATKAMGAILQDESAMPGGKRALRFLHVRRRYAVQFTVISSRRQQPAPRCWAAEAYP
jgi:hypothetical protein